LNVRCAWLWATGRRAILISLVPAIFAAAPVAAFEPEAEHQICAEAVAYSSRLPAAERSRREQEAKDEALDNLSRRVWADALKTIPGAPRSARTDALLRSRYNIKDRLAVGNSYFVGGKDHKDAVFCVSTDVYTAVRTSIRRERKEAIERLQQEFATLEQLIETGDLDSASKSLTVLDIEVMNEALEQTPFESTINGRTRPFRVWLLEWSDVVPKGAEFVDYMNGQAATLIAMGHLDAADRYLSKALRVERNNSGSRELRFEIQELRNRQAELLGEAERLAQDGKFAAAERRLDEARAITSDNPLLIEETSRTIDGLQAEDLQYNPMRRISLYAALGTLGIDTSGIEERVSAASGSDADGSAPISFGAGAQFALNRVLIVGLSGSLGFSQDESLVFGGSPLELYQFYQFTAGFGFRTTRSARRLASYQFTVGPAWEWADTNALFQTELDSNDSQLGAYARFAVEFKSTVIFLQHGLGFSDNGDATLIAWGNNFQAAVAFAF
jgi:tetratricopeptide (TPR) repeat protein